MKTPHAQCQPVSGPDTLSELADRCEKATGADVTINGDIWKALNPNSVNGWHAPNGVSIDGYARYISPAYTASIDAAMTLVPEGCAASVEWSPRFPGYAWLFPPDNEADVQFEGEAKSPALALCAAALRARRAAS